ncbi:MAG: bifunctional DNA-formamidopyrimidine glycosylase/DNA-(apurinic or apyrimidinic site) lyase [Phycisphaerales bacterium]|nr:bifunctional DNA-formamidopyrimidine glycosylase/DNA-(apurinic or apyrimidinic site) lyase [Phycisphaerales bacterium]
MPELPEVERTRLSLLPIVGRRVLDARLFRTDICDSYFLEGQPKRTTRGDLLKNKRIGSLIRRGKQLAILSDDDNILCIQLGMSGRLCLLKPSEARALNLPEQPRSMFAFDDKTVRARTARERVRAKLPKHTHALWKLSSGAILLFIDPRRFGGLSTYWTERAFRKLRWSALGPDALTITARDLARACEGSHRPIKSLLLDQSALAGVGNIYADESLFRARINPSTHASSLTKPQLTSLASAIRFILARAIKAGGSTLRDYADSTGTKGNAQSLHAVYGRANMPCPNCSHPLRGTRLAQRATVFCPVCQPSPPKPHPQMKPA